MKRNKSKSVKSKSNNNRGASGSRPAQWMKPPPYLAVKPTKRKYRFITSAAFTGVSPCTITSAKLCSLEVIGTTTNVSATQLFEAVRIKRIQMWAWADMSSGTVTPASISLTFEGASDGQLGNHLTLSDSSNSIEVPAYIDYRPKAFSSQALQWQPGDTSLGSDSLFTIVAPAKTILDITLELRATRNIRTTSNTVALSTVVLTNYYYLALDNPAGGTGSGSSAWVPDPSLQTTI